MIAAAVRLMFLIQTPTVIHLSLPPDVVRRKAQEIVSRPEYQVDQGFSDESQALWMTLLSWFLKPFLWLFEALNGLPTPLRLLVVLLLCAALIVLIVHMVWSFANAVRGSRIDRLTAGKTREQQVDPAQLERAAESAAVEGRYLEAVRHLFKAALVRIEQSDTRKMRVGITNRELLRRYQKTPLLTPLSGMVECIDRKWYGAEVCELSDYQSCRVQLSSICDVLQRRRHAVGA